MQADLVVGVDVGKDELVVAVADRVVTYANSPTGRRRLVTTLMQQSVRLVVLEASGGYERDLLRALWTADVPVRRVNPRQVRDFARASGRLAKTDTLDAVLLVHFGTVMQLRPQVMPSRQRQELADLQAYRQSLVAQRVANQNRLQQATDHRIRTSLEQVLAVIQEQIIAVEMEMDTVIANCPELQAQVTVLQSMPGIGRTTARLLVAAVPELGQASSREIAALVGVAPMNHDSGRYRGTRRIRGGRPQVRAGLYMAAVVASKHNPVLKPFAERLRAQGKPGLVVITAVMRKLLTMLNAMLRDGTPWHPPVLQEAIPA
jgi:transposase